MNRLGIEMPKSEILLHVDEAAGVAAELGYPVVIRPAYTMGAQAEVSSTTVRSSG